MQERVEARGGDGGHGEGASNIGAVAEDAPSALFAAAVAAEGGEPCESGNAPAVELAQLGHLSDQRPGDGVVEVAFYLLELGFQESDVSIDALD